MKANGSHCGLHFGRDCDCDHHCPGCRNAYSTIKDDCCTCCRSLKPVGLSNADPVQSLTTEEA